MPKFLFFKSLVKFPQIPKIFTGHRKTLGNQGLFLNFDIEFLFVPLKFPKNDRFLRNCKNSPVSSHPAPKQAFLFIQTKLLSVYPFRGEPKFANSYQTTWNLRQGANSPWKSRIWYGVESQARKHFKQNLHRSIRRFLFWSWRIRGFAIENEKIVPKMLVFKHSERRYSWCPRRESNSRPKIP